MGPGKEPVCRESWLEQKGASLSLGPGRLRPSRGLTTCLSQLRAATGCPLHRVTLKSLTRSPLPFYCPEARGLPCSSLPETRWPGNEDWLSAALSPPSLPPQHLTPGPRWRLRESQVGKRERARPGREKMKQALPALPHNPVTPSHIRLALSLATCLLCPQQKSEVQSVTRGDQVRIPPSLLHSCSRAAAAAPLIGGGDRAPHINDCSVRALASCLLPPSSLSCTDPQSPPRQAPPRSVPFSLARAPLNSVLMLLALT